jgi:hypothetical protein
MAVFRYASIVSLLAVLVVKCNGQCTGSANNCVDQQALNQLSTADPTYYCERGAILLAQAKKCMDECKAVDTTGYLRRKQAEIDQFCSQASANCSSVTETYINQTKCYEPYGGIDSVLANIFNQFENKVASIDCKHLYWARYCQSQVDCRYNRELDLQLVKEHPQVVLALHVCRSEKAGPLGEQLVNNEKCTSELNTKIESECSIACEIAYASDSATVCSLLEKQAGCFERLTLGCTTAARRYSLPRLDTYAIANKYLGCSIKFNGLTIMAPTLSVCEYSEMLNACFFAQSIENAITFDRLMPLFNMDLPVGGFCKTIVSEKKDKLNACIAKYLECPVPQARLLLPESSQYDNSYAPSIGGFPLNVWGMNTVYNALPNPCTSNLRWTTQICVQTEEPKTTKPPKKTTPNPKVDNGTRNDRGQTNSPKKENGVGGLQLDSELTNPTDEKDVGNMPQNSENAGNTVVMSLILLVTSALVAKLVPCTNFSM